NASYSQRERKHAKQQVKGTGMQRGEWLTTQATGITLRHQVPKCYGLTNVEGIDDDNVNHSEGGGDNDDDDGDDWGQQHRDTSKSAQQQIDSPSKPLAFERKMATFHHHRAHKLGDSIMKALQELAVQYGKPVQHILKEAGLKKLATRGKQQWNLHQKWYAICHPITNNESVKEYCLRQKEHYVTHSDEEEHAALWQDIREHGNAIVHEGELSTKSLATLIEEAREQFAKGASTWSHLEGVEVIGMVVYKGHDSIACHAAGWFGGLTFVRELINSHELQLAKWLDYVTTVI
ncbi:hypothetical protein BDN67DRAFT_986285, partial [Paxillus ammoniavirescens]